MQAARRKTMLPKAGIDFVSPKEYNNCKEKEKTGCFCGPRGGSAMPRYAKDINAIYISERMQENLRHIRERAMTSIVAPMGYGKTTAALWYLEERQRKGDAVFRVNIYSSDVNLFWQSFCSAFRRTELGERLKGTEFPADPTAVHMLIQNMTDYLNDAERDVFLLIDDCHLMEDSRVFSLLFSLCDIPTDKLHMIVVSRSVVFLRGEELHLGKKLYKITVDDMRLNRTELAAYLRRCGVELAEEEFETLFRNSEGWFSCVYLNLCNYEKFGALLSKSEDIYAMIGDALYAGYDEGKQRFLMDLCIADEFTAEQAEFIAQRAGTREMLKDLAQNNAFIRFLPDTSTYRFHHMLRSYVEQLVAQQDAAWQKALKLRYARWHESKKQYIRAMRFYGEADDMVGVLHVIGLDRGVQLASASPDSILELLDRCKPEELLREPQAMLVLMRRMFTCRRIPKMLELKGMLMQAAARPDISEEERGNILGECDLIMSFLRYNDISAMSQLHRNASKLMTRPAVSIQKTGSWTFSSPSVLMMYHREPGMLDSEINEMNQCMPYYYRLTDGHGIGAEQTMEAEALFNRGKLDDAHIMLEKARAIVDDSQQHYIRLCCDLLAQRLALCGVLPYREDWYAEKLELFKTLHDPMLFTVLDGCAAYIHALQGQQERIPAWLREGKLTEANILSPGRPMFEIICNQVLLSQKQYATVLGRGDGLLAACRGIPYLLCEIHLHIQLAAAAGALGKQELALAELKTALDQSIPDGIFMPFAENSKLLEPLFAALPAQYLDAVQRIRDLGALRKPKGNAAHAGWESLTEREKTVAALYVSGKNRKEIAGLLFLSEGTVKNYISTIYDKLELSGTPKQKHHALAKIAAENEKK